MPSNSSEATRSRIYQAALREFAQYGVAGARVERIAQAARANKQAIYLYFGDKEHLFATVLERSLGELAEAVPVEANDVAGYVDRLFGYHLKHPEVLRLLMWEALEFTDHEVPDEATRARHYGFKAAAIGAELPSEAVGGLDGRSLLLILTGLVGWPLVVPQVRRMIMGDGQDSMQQMRAATAEAAMAVVRHARGQSMGTGSTSVSTGPSATPTGPSTTPHRASEHAPEERPG